MTTLEKKALSLDELSGLVRHEFDEFCQQMTRERAVEVGAALMVDDALLMPTVCNYWVIDVYTDYLVCGESAGEYYRVPFTITADGVQFPPMAEWASVEKEWVDTNYPNAAEEIAADMEGKTLIAYGGEIKAAKNGNVSGYLVIFGTPSDADFDGDFFTKETDFGFTGEVKTPVYYHHGLDKTLKLRRLEKEATIGIDDVGVWIKTQLALRDEYEQAIDEMLIKRKKAGWSSGTASHLVERKAVGNAKQITRWHLGLDASITPTPNDYRNVVSIKALQNEPLQIKSLINSLATETDQPEANVPETAQAVVHAGEAGDVTETAVKSAANTALVLPQINANGETKMADVQTPPVDEVAELKSQVSTLQGQIDIILKAPAIKTAEIAQPESEAEIKAKDNEAAIKAFEHYARTGEYSKGLKAAYAEGTSSTGGYLVPTQYSNELVMQRRYLSILRAAGAKVIKVAGTNSFKVPTMTDSTAAILTAEAGAFSEVEATFGETAFVPYKYTKLVKASDEVLNDTRIPLMDIIGPDATQAFAAAENAAFTTGTGSSQPQGVVTGASAGVTAAGVAAITADEVIDLYHSLADLYRMNAVWMMSDTALKLIRKLKDTTNQYLWSPGLAAGEPSTILGRPVYVNNSIAVPATGVKSVLFGDLSYFWIADFGGEEMKRLNELYAGNGQVGFRWYSRFDSHVMLSAALKVLTQA